MEFPGKCEIEKAVSKDQFRPNVGVAHLWVETKRLIATDGHMLAVVPVKVTEGDVTGPITVDAIKAARKAAGKHGDAVIVCGKDTAVVGGAGTTTFRREDVGPFPAVDQLIPQVKEGDKDTITIGLDANLLATLAKAIGTDGKVTLTFGLAKLALDPFLVKPIDKTNDAFGVLMPYGKGR